MNRGIREKVGRVLKTQDMPLTWASMIIGDQEAAARPAVRSKPSRVSTYRSSHKAHGRKSIVPSAARARSVRLSANGHGQSSATRMSTAVLNSVELTPQATLPDERHELSPVAGSSWAARE